MIREVEGDILFSKAEAIAHGIAPLDDFKHGLALSLRERWPSLYNDFRHFCHIELPTPGSLWVWRGVGGFTCFNLFTQEPAKVKGAHPEKATLSNVNHCIRELHKEAQIQKIKSIALPRIATGVGGLEWKDVKPIIEKHFANDEITLFLYNTYKKDIPAKEF